MRFIIELRVYDDHGDYQEDYYVFDRKEECIKFAKENRNEVYSVHDYEDRDYDPVNLNY